MNGMKQKAQRRQREKQYTADGLPRDTRDWTEQDWADLHHAIEEVKRKIAKRHQQAKEERNA